jgi:hypothetical protein
VSHPPIDKADKNATTKKCDDCENLIQTMMFDFDGSMEIYCLDTCLMVGTAFGVLEILDHK